jgi:hypothetical protein
MPSAAAPQVGAAAAATPRTPKQLLRPPTDGSKQTTLIIPRTARPAVTQRCVHSTPIDLTSSTIHAEETALSSSGPAAAFRGVASAPVAPSSVAAAATSDDEGPGSTLISQSTSSWKAHLTSPEWSVIEHAMEEERRTQRAEYQDAWSKIWSAREERKLPSRLPDQLDVANATVKRQDQHLQRVADQLSAVQAESARLRQRIAELTRSKETAEREANQLLAVQLRELQEAQAESKSKSDERIRSLRTQVEKQAEVAAEDAKARQQFELQLQLQTSTLEQQERQLDDCRGQVADLKRRHDRTRDCVTPALERLPQQANWVMSKLLHIKVEALWRPDSENTVLIVDELMDALEQHHDASVGTLKKVWHEGDYSGGGRLKSPSGSGTFIRLVQASLFRLRATCTSIRGSPSAAASAGTCQQSSKEASSSAAGSSSSSIHLDASCAGRTEFESAEDRGEVHAIPAEPAALRTAARASLLLSPGNGKSSRWTEARSACADIVDPGLRGIRMEDATHR